MPLPLPTNWTPNHAPTAPELKQLLDFVTPNYVRRTSDGPALTTTATLADDAVLKLPGVANAEYQVRGRLKYSGTDTTADLLVGFSGPSGAVFDWSTPDGIEASAGAVDGAQWAGGFAIGATAVYGTVNGILIGSFEGVFITGANAGNLQLRVSRNGVSGTTQLLTHCWMEMWRKA